MKFIRYILALTIFCLYACSENERMTYEEKPALYFTYPMSQDSLNYSFTMTKNDEEILHLQVKLLGNLLKEDTPFIIGVGSGSTAIEGLHYEALEQIYLFPKEKVIFDIPLKIYKTEDMASSIVSLNLNIKENENFDPAYGNWAEIKVRLTNQLIKPTYWDSPLALYFGTYSKVKHQKAIDIMGHDFPLTSTGLDVNYYMLIGRSTAMYFALNPTLDENGILIEPWPTF